LKDILLPAKLTFLLIIIIAGFETFFYVVRHTRIEVGAKTKESIGKTEEELRGRNKECHERKKPKRRAVGI
jgi:hypothetical protein